MCDNCGCNVTPGNEHLLAPGAPLATTESGRESVEVLHGLLAANDEQARHNREHFDRHGVFAVNLMSSPGAGKTALLEATIDAQRSGLLHGLVGAKPDVSSAMAPVSQVPSNRGMPVAQSTWV